MKPSLWVLGRAESGWSSQIINSDRSQEIGVGWRMVSPLGALFETIHFQFSNSLWPFSLFPLKKIQEASLVTHWAISFDLGATACMVWSQPHCLGTGCPFSEGLRDGHLGVCFRKTDRGRGRVTVASTPGTTWGTQSSLLNFKNHHRPPCGQHRLVPGQHSSRLGLYLAWREQEPVSLSV